MRAQCHRLQSRQTQIIWKGSTTDGWEICERNLLWISEKTVTVWENSYWALWWFGEVHSRQNLWHSELTVEEPYLLKSLNRTRAKKPWCHFHLVPVVLSLWQEISPSQFFRPSNACTRQPLLNKVCHGRIAQGNGQFLLILTQKSESVDLSEPLHEEIFKGKKPIKRKKLKQYQMCPNLLITNANISSTRPETLGGC